MLYLGCHLWMKLLKLSIQSIILLYQLLVREHRKKSRLRSAASQLLLGLALSHDYVSKNSLAFTCQTLFKDTIFLPTKINQFEWKHKNLFYIKRKIFPAPLYTIWFPWSRQKICPHCLSPLDAKRDHSKRAHTNKGIWLLFQSVPQTIASFHSLENCLGQHISLTCPECFSGLRRPQTSSEHHTQGLTS